jgi:DNA (cytosine-5)-methyltransferase 3A
MNVLSLFDGISAGQLALQRAGIKVDKYFASEIEEFSIKVTQHHFPNTIQLGDVTKIKGSDLPKIDLLIGGSPCQSFSKIGNNLGFEGKSGLFYEYVRLLNEVKPKFFLLENVLMSKENEYEITKCLGIEPIMIDSALVSAQRRRRLYWTNIKTKKQGLFGIPVCDIPQPVDKKIMFSDILEDLPFEELKPFAFGNWGNKTRLFEMNCIANDKSNTLTTKNTHTAQYLLNSDKTKMRKLSISEYEKLQTLPENYISKLAKNKSEGFKAIGNSWTVDVIAHILGGINE